MNVSQLSSAGSIEAQEMLAKARQVQASGNFAYAEMLCANILRREPGEQAARMVLRSCQMARFHQKHGAFRPAGKMGSGIGFFTPKASADPLRDAELAETALKENPCEVAANHLLQSAAQRLGWPEIEQLCLDQIAEGSPTAENLIAKAHGLRERRDFRRAIAVLEKAQKQIPGNLHLDKALRDLLAEAASASGWEEANTFTDVVKPSVPEDDAHLLAGKIEADPRNAALVDQLILVLERAGDDTDALAWISYRREIEESPALRRKALEMRRRQGTLTPEMELEELEAFVKQQPTDLELRLALGTALLRRGDAAAAIPQLQRARKNGKIRLRVESILALAEAYDQAGLAGLGEKSRTQALELAGEDESLQKEILYRMALSLQSLGRSEESRARWIELFEVDAEYKDVAAHVLGAAARCAVDS